MCVYIPCCAGEAGRRVATYLEWREAPLEPLRDPMAGCGEPAAEDLELGYPGRQVEALRGQMRYDTFCLAVTCFCRHIPMW